MSKIIYPKPRVIARKINNAIYEEARQLGATEVQAKILAGRSIPDGVDLEGVLRPNFSYMPKVSLLKDIEKAGDRISEAIINQEYIGLLCDFDVDGISSTAVLSKALTDFFHVEPFRIKYFISNRMTEGYGFSQKVLDRVMSEGEIPTLLITADQGSSDAERVTSFYTQMKEKGIDFADVVVTDHHEIPKNGGPKDACAFVNPQQKDDQFPDNTICGCTVALFVMAATRTALIAKKYLSKDAPRIQELLAYATAATIADCVSMASPTNRAIVSYGLNEINSESIPAWRIMKQDIIKEKEQPVRSDSIGFGLGPRINACSRTGGDGLNGVRYYLSETDMDARRYFEMLDFNNEERKEIEKRLLEDATVIASDLVQKGHMSLTIFLKNGHHGIHGIVASRIVEKFGRPVICLSPKDVETESYVKSVDMDIESVEKITDKSFEDMKALRATLAHPKNKKIAFHIDKKENYKELSGRERISKITRVQSFFSKDEVLKILAEDLKIAVNKRFKDFYSLSPFSYVKIFKKSKDVYYIETTNIKTLSGSGRSIDGLETAQGKESFDLHHCLTEISMQDTELFIGFGGHTMAAGMALPTSKLDKLKELFEGETRKHLEDSDIGPKIFMDGELPVNDISLDFVDEVLGLEPYGRQFDYPSYAVTGHIESIDIRGKNKDTGIFLINIHGKSYKAVWFKFIDNAMFPFLKPGQRCRFVVSITDNYFQGSRSPSIQLVHAVNF